MELILNLAWLLIAGVIVCLWLRGANPGRPNRRGQLTALVIVIAILFPVISVSDDLLAGQNAAVEASNFQRRDHLAPSKIHPVQPELTILASVLTAGLGFGPLRLIAPSLLPIHKPGHLEFAAIFNRPPPSA